MKYVFTERYYKYLVPTVLGTRTITIKFRGTWICVATSNRPILISDVGHAVMNRVKPVSRNFSDPYQDEYTSNNTNQGEWTVIEKVRSQHGTGHISENRQGYHTKDFRAFALRCIRVVVLRFNQRIFHAVHNVSIFIEYIFNFSTKPDVLCRGKS